MQRLLAKQETSANQTQINWKPQIRRFLLALNLQHFQSILRPYSLQKRTPSQTFTQNDNSGPFQKASFTPEIHKQEHLVLKKKKKMHLHILGKRFFVSFYFSFCFLINERNKNFPGITRKSSRIFQITYLIWLVDVSTSS